MIDFHTHILPGVDDGAGDIETALAMLREEAAQGVNQVFATPHFYADEETPEAFLIRREAAYQAIGHRARAMEGLGPKADGPIPNFMLGAEVYYFPGMADCKELKAMALGTTRCLLVEPPMATWTRAMLEEIESCGSKLGLVPIVAHVDRYCRILEDYRLFDILQDRRVLIQVNASFFIHEDTRDYAMELLREGRIHCIGSDAHNMERRAPNLGTAAETIRNAGEAKALARLTEKWMEILGLRA